MFGVIAAGVAIMAITLSIWHGSFVRLEMAAFIGLVFLWGAWAIIRMLGTAGDEGARGRNW